MTDWGPRQQLQSQLDRAIEDEAHYRKLASEHSRGIWNALFSRGIRRECYSRAEWNREEIKRIKAKIHELETSIST